ncbi:MAG: hypothetical protein K2H82_07730 [Oscillospiraceae bacterium]|nr:hypothetical protein [Oscillospiraceae bacterium]
MCLCSRFLSLNPFQVRSQRFHDVLLIFRRLRSYDKNQNAATNKKSRTQQTKKGIVMRPAQNDDWY